MMVRELSQLEAWAKSNAREARIETFRFWALKLPAIGGAATTGIFGYLGWEVASLMLGAAAATCVAIDALNPTAGLRNAHLRAVHDLSNLQHKMVNAWDTSEWTASDDSARMALATRIIVESQPERDRIAAALRDAEARLAEQSARQ